ncbi:ribosomal-processing cysteine protease Prp [Sulfobacillus sp. hq2]|uniref:Ribosomal processing cysteine protease Prp n=1 Tax=Sulfobacillus thermotolerans TaxID=338644 RepID=A0ABM6RP69_9FIRM|nr:ribosomal-processing cysteine protease Prp [Sulfobacillus sp. hq2]AUW93171.1 hypothetical protein BXT84_03730 [Sulfobacillus thermotolerans]MCY0908398.1 ribosomal-processing cysteine protease Prp [Sulfobacillus thermotolerans]POB11797.1 ribosomal-processing cysteine protease Prp [Sulfobacillus sp. hq2]
MIKIVVERDSQGSVHRLRVTGHAGQAPYGKDIVCAAASALSETLIMGLTRVERTPIEYRLDDGVLDLHITDKLSESSRSILETFCLGFKDLADTAPDFVRYREMT